MSALAYYEPHKLSAGALALVVHTLFFSMLYFGVNWNVKIPPNMQVEMWGSLPDPVPDPLPEPPPQPAPPVIEPIAQPKVAEPVAPLKADIELKEKKKEKIAKVKDEKQDAKIKQREVEIRREVEMQRAATAKAAHENQRIQELQAKMRAEMDSALRGEVERYKDLISAKIKRNKINPPDVAENAEAIFFITVLPGGTVINVKLEHSSGNPAYDSAAERAIYKAEPLPLPQDPTLARMFRELRLSVKP